MPNRLLLRVLATAVLAGERTVEGVTERVAKTLGRDWKWIRPAPVIEMSFASLFKTKALAAPGRSMPGN